MTIRVSKKDINNLSKMAKKYGDDLMVFIGDEVPELAGQKMIDEMQKQIAAGISPIAKFGRFPEYKATSAINILRKINKGGGKLRKLALKTEVANITRKGYPYNTKQFKAGSKRVRPVNLNLGGAFLKDLTYRIFKNGKKAILEIGYFTGLSAKKEQGHREGVHGQPSRPTIPDITKGEDFNAKINHIFYNIIGAAILKFTKRNR